VPNPFDVQSFDRYAYVSNPTRYTQCSGHCVDGLTKLPCVAAVAIFLAVYYVSYDAYVLAGGLEAVANGITETANWVSEQTAEQMRRVFEAANQLTRSATNNWALARG
jgi:hypothetical protein